MNLIINGTEYPVHTRNDSRNGVVFATELDGNPIASPTFAGLRTALTKAIKAAAAKVEVSLWVVVVPYEHSRQEITVRPLTARGIHSRSHALLITWGDTGEKDTLPASAGYQYLFTTAEAAETYAALARARITAVRAEGAHRDTHRVDGYKLMREAIDKAVNGGNS